MAEAGMQAELERLRAENEKLKRGDRRKLVLHISEKGAVSVYERGRFPATFYMRPPDRRDTSLGDGKVLDVTGVQEILHRAGR